MISRTILEWHRIRYGEAEGELPEWAAERVAAVARSSTLGGEDGARIIQYGKKFIRAQQVVGVIAAENCALEILPKIEGLGDGETADSKGAIRRNLVHMLAVALDLRIGVGRITDLEYQSQDLLEILIRLFCDKLFDAVHRGLPRRYIATESDLPTLRGKLDVVRQFSVLAARAEVLACRYDTLSSDIPLNQIMKAAVTRLKPLSRSPANQRKLRELDLAFVDIDAVPVQSLRWDKVVLDRTNQNWHELLGLARLLLGDRFQATSIGGGSGFSLLFEMNTLFEEYVGRMLQRAMTDTGRKVALQGGRLYCLTEVNQTSGLAGAERFMTKPDILVRRGRDVEIIIDTKWKRLSTKIDNAKQGVGQADVYQMMAYGRIYQCPTLVLLYPHSENLNTAPGMTRLHQVNGSDDRLVAATVDVSTLDTVPSQLTSLVSKLDGIYALGRNDELRVNEGF